MKNIKLLFCLIIFVISPKLNSQTLFYNFTTGYEGWIGDFADYPITDSVSYELKYNRTTLPSPLNTSKYALKIKGNNHSDDLFMFIKRKVTGLLPNTTYQLLIEVEFASNAPTNASGVGGSPGEGVVMKVGATIIEPLKIIDASENYRMNIDKGGQMDTGVDMDTIGHIGVTDTTTVFTLIKRSNTARLFTIKTNSKGEVWVCIGTESAFEAVTTLYYNEIKLIFTSQLPVELTTFNASVKGSGIELYWETATEVNNNGFEVQKLNNKCWETLKFIKGNGNSNSPKSYSYSDVKAVSGRNVYRLKQIDYNGNYKISNEVEIEKSLQLKYDIFQNYPNPFNPVTNITFTVPQKGNIKITVYNIKGEFIKTLVNREYEQGLYNVNFDGSNLSSGMYLYRIQAGNFIKTMKMMLVK